MARILIVDDDPLRSPAQAGAALPLPVVELLASFVRPAPAMG